MVSSFFINSARLASFPLYFSIFKTCQFFIFIFSPATKLWYRNSLYTKNVMFPFSDIDFTVIVSSRDEAKKVLSLLKKLKIIFPILGEVNVYIPKEIEKIKEIFNDFEISRDPILVSRYFNPLKNFTEAKAKCFSARMLAADRNNLTLRPSFRVSKWKSHYEKLAAIFPSLFLSKDLRTHYANDISIFTCALELNDFLDQVALISHSKLSLGSFDSHELSHFTLLYLPAEAITWAILCRELPELVKKVKKLNLNEQEITREGMRWELWGIYTQLDQINDKDQLIDHLKNMKFIFKELNWGEEERGAELLLTLSTPH